jgi:hypothetical protein
MLSWRAEPIGNTVPAGDRRAAFGDAMGCRRWGAVGSAPWRGCGGATARTIRTWADVQAIFAMPGVRPAVIIAALLLAIGWTLVRAAAFATSLRQRATDVWVDEERRNLEFEAPDDHQLRWHISHIVVKGPYVL